MTLLDLGDLPAPKTLAKVKSVKTIDKKKGLKEVQDDTTVEIAPESIIGLSQPIATNDGRRKVNQGEAR